MTHIGRSQGFQFRWVFFFVAYFKGSSVWWRCKQNASPPSACANDFTLYHCCNNSKHTCWEDSWLIWVDLSAHIFPWTETWIFWLFCRKIGLFQVEGLKSKWCHESLMSSHMWAESLFFVLFFSSEGNRFDSNLSTSHVTLTFTSYIFWGKSSNQQQSNNRMLLEKKILQMFRIRCVPRKLQRSLPKTFKSFHNIRTTPW